MLANSASRRVANINASVSSDGVNSLSTREMSPIVTSLPPAATTVSPTQTASVSSHLFTYVLVEQLVHSLTPIHTFGACRPSLDSPRCVQVGFGAPAGKSIVVLGADTRGNYSSSTLHSEETPSLVHIPAANNASGNSNGWSVATSDGDYAPLFLGTIPRGTNAASHLEAPLHGTTLASTARASYSFGGFSTESSSGLTTTSAALEHVLSTFS